MPGFYPPGSPLFRRPRTARLHYRPGTKSPDSPNYMPGLNPAIPAHRLPPYGFVPRKPRTRAPRPSAQQGALSPTPTGAVRRFHQKPAPTKVTPTQKVMAGKPDPIAGNHPKGSKPNRTKQKRGGGAGGSGGSDPLSQILAGLTGGGAGGQTIQQMVDAALAPLYAQIDAAQRQYGQFSAGQQQQSAALTHGLLQELAGEPAQLAALYDQAGHQVDALAQAGAARLAAANPGAAINTELQAIGAPATQQQQVSSHLGDVFTGGAAVLGHLQGTIPGQALAQESAARQAFALGNRNVAVAREQQQLGELSRAAEQQAREFANQRMQVAAKAPELTLQYQSAAQDAAQKRAALAINALIARGTLGIKTQHEAFQQGATVTKLKQGAAKIKADADRFDKQYRLYFAKVFGVDPVTGTPTLQARVAASRAGELEAKRRARAANGGFTAGQRQHLRQLAAETASEAFHGVYKMVKGQSVLVHPRVSYQQSILDLINAGVPLVIAQNALARYWNRNAPGARIDGGQILMPWEQPGHGRPLVPFQQRQRKPPRGY